MQPTPDDLVERIDRLVLRHQELKRSAALMEQQIQALGAERDSLRSRLSAARGRIDALLARLPGDDQSPAAPVAAPAAATAEP